MESRSREVEESRRSTWLPDCSTPRLFDSRLFQPPVLGVPAGVLPRADGETVQEVGVDTALAELEDGEADDVLTDSIGDLTEVGAPHFDVRRTVGGVDPFPDVFTDPAVEVLAARIFRARDLVRRVP